MRTVRRILLVEDDQRDIELTLRAFHKANLLNPIDVTRNGIEALQYLKREGPYVDRELGDPAVILVDIKMPKMNGHEFVQALRSDSMIKTIPVVFLTSSREQQDLLSSYELGANAYVVKPVSFDEFVAAANRIGAFWVMLNEPPTGGQPA